MRRRKGEPLKGWQVYFSGGHDPYEFRPALERAIEANRRNNAA